MAVGTPGRVWTILNVARCHYERIAYLVIDEADEMLNMGFIEQVQSNHSSAAQDRVTMLFSATFPEDVAKLSRKYMDNPIEIEIKASGITTATIEHPLYRCKKRTSSHCFKTCSLWKVRIVVLCSAVRRSMWINCSGMADLDYPCRSDPWWYGAGRAVRSDECVQKGTIPLFDCDRCGRQRY